MPTSIANTAPSSLPVQKSPSEGGKNKNKDLGLTEVLILTAVCYLLYIVLISLFGGYWANVRGFGDNPYYVVIATGIRHWDLGSIHVWQFWGLPYAMVAVSFFTHLPFLSALYLLSVVGSLIAVAISYRLWGGWVAAIFAVASREWLERSLLGGAEPLFLALLFGSFLAARKKHWVWAALLAALSTVVRPMGIFALVGIGVALLIQRKYRDLALTTAVGLAIGLLYIIPFKVYLDNPMANVRSYGEVDGSGGKPLTYPFGALIHGPTAWGSVNFDDVGAGKSTRLNFARTSLWIGIVFFGAIAMALNREFREYGREHLVELVFCGLYIALLFTYNSPWARATFPRYSIPVIPFLTLAVLRWIPRDRRLLWAFALGSTAIAAVATIGIRDVLALAHKIL